MVGEKRGRISPMPRVIRLVFSISPTVDAAIVMATAVIFLVIRLLPASVALGIVPLRFA